MKLLLLIVFGCVIIFLISFMVLYLFADHIKPMQKIYCKFGWHCHMKDYQQISFDGCSQHCKCKWCGYIGMVDSQGNLF